MMVLLTSVHHLYVCASEDIHDLNNSEKSVTLLAEYF